VNNNCQRSKEIGIWTGIPEEGKHQEIHERNRESVCERENKRKKQMKMDRKIK
jgi:hypothetical protein